MVIQEKLEYCNSLQRKCNGFVVKLLQYINKSIKALTSICFMCTQDTREGIVAVIRNPGKLSAVVIEKAGSQADSFTGSNVSKCGVVIRTVKIGNLS